MAADWPQWRGPAFNGSSPETGLPAVFSPTENMRWKVAMPGPAGSTPIVQKGKVYVTAAVEADNLVVALCLDAKTGKELWRHAIAEGYRGDDRSNYAGPSPAADDERVVFFAGTGDLVAFTLDGKELWKRNVEKDYGSFAFLWTFSSSPLLHDGRLYLQVLQRDEAFQAHGGLKGNPNGSNDSYLLALNPADGSELWRVTRPSDAISESLEAFSTPVPAVLKGRPELVVAGGDCVSGHDPATGKELWRWGTWNPDKIGHWRLVPSPVTAKDTVLVCAPKGAPVYAVKAGLEGAHTQEEDLAWRSKFRDEDMPSRAWRDVSSDVSTPLFYQGHYYILNGEKQTLACVVPETGEVLWHESLGGRTKIEGSPTGADGKIYVMDHRGDVYVVKADPTKFQLLHKTEMASAGAKDLRASIAIAENSLFIRTADTLWCAGLTEKE